MDNALLSMKGISKIPWSYSTSKCRFDINKGEVVTVIGEMSRQIYPYQDVLEHIPQLGEIF